MHPTIDLFDHLQEGEIFVGMTRPIDPKQGIHPSVELGVMLRDLISNLRVLRIDHSFVAALIARIKLDSEEGGAHSKRVFD